MRMLNFLKHKTSSDIQLAEFDSIRGWAIIFVVMHHFYVYSGSPAWNYKLLTFFIGSSGDAGIDLFFFISGFLLFLNYGKAFYSGSPEPSIKKFYKRRILRIVPAYYLFMGLIIIIDYNKYIWTSQGWYNILSHLFFIHSLFPQYQRSILNVFWTLGVEFQFYLILPFIANWFYGKRFLISLPIFILFGFLFRTFAYFLFPSCKECPINFIDNLPGRIDEFAIGMAFANGWFLMKNRIEGFEKKKWLGNLFIILGIIFCLITIFFVNYSLRVSNIHNYFYLVVWHLPYAFFIGMTIYGLMISKDLKKIFVNPFMGFIGVISYSLYLCHNYFLNKIITLNLFTYLSGFLKLGFIILTIGTISLLYAFCSYCFIERPFLKRG